MAEFPASMLCHEHALYLLENQKRMSAAQKRMAKEHPHLIWVNQKYKGVPYTVRNAVWSRGDGKCIYCGCYLTVATFTVDHVLARANGGGDEDDNLVIACRPCNSSKKDKFIE